jgi:oleate hydratase
MSKLPSLDEITANALEYVHDGKTASVKIGPKDVVLVTIGSQIADLAIGSMTAPAVPHLTGRSWALWERLARARPEFGRPDVFFGEQHIRDAKWMTFTVTTTDPTFFELMKAFSGSEPGRGGLMTFKD